MNNFTIKKPFFQIPSIQCYKEFEKIDKFMEILQKSEICKIIESVNKNKNKCKGRTSYNPYNMMATILYCFSEFKSSVRELEKLCYTDLRVIYLIEQEEPSYATFCDFINTYIKPYSLEIFSAITFTIIKEYHINIDNQYIDGTKLEANANKYKFVWKPKTYHKKLNSKIKDLISVMNYSYENTNYITAKEFNELIINYANINNIDYHDIPRGKGKKLTAFQRIIKTGYEYLNKLIEYEEKERICGEERNSYYKTDKDATAMILKEDYYSKLSHDFHAAYNTQVIVSSGLITMYGVFQKRDDQNTLIPMLERYKKGYGNYPTNLCGDSGYGIYKNYEFLHTNNIGNYLKFVAWNGETSGKRPQLFFFGNGNFKCLNGIVGKYIFTKTHPRYKDSKFYIFEGCDNCKYSYKCKEYLKDKSQDFRRAELSIKYETYKDEARKNLLSPDGIEIRINRSIQVEGTYGQIKQNMNYTRFRRRGMDSVECEFMLECLGVNIRKLFKLLDNPKLIKKSYWDRPFGLQKEVIPDVKPKEKKMYRK